MEREGLAKKGYSTAVTAALFIAVFLLAAACYLFLPDSCPEAARRTAFVFVVAALFWALEILPLYVTSLLVIALLALLLGKPGGVLNMGYSGYTLFFSPLSSPVIMLFFGGFMLAEALKKYKVDHVITHQLVSLFGTKPLHLLFGILATTAFLSMWISNTVATALILAILLPSIESAEVKGSFKKALLLAVPYGANIGGITTPIGSPPNAIAMGFLAEYGIIIDFVEWVMICLPLMVIVLSIACWVLYTLYPPEDEAVELEPHEEHTLDRKGKVVLAITFATILLFLTFPFHGIPEALVALLCVCALLIPKLIGIKELKAISWDILLLMWGGLSLGIAVAKTGLGSWLVTLPLLAQHDALLIFIFCLIAALLSTFISNTATVALLLPIALGIEGENKIALAITITLVSNLAMVLPISTPPNALAYSSNLFESKDMVKAGLFITLISTLLILIGYELVIPLVL